MSRWRRRMVNAFVIFVIAGSLYDVVRDQEHWPFSQYPMFSGVWRDTPSSWYRLVGIDDNGREFILDHSRFLRPFDPSRLHLALVQVARRADADRSLRSAMENCLDRYERLRALGRH